MSRASLVRLALFTLLLTLVIAGCQPVAEPASGMPAAQAPTTLVVASHDSFSASEEVIAAFEAAHNARVQVLTLGDAGAALNKLVLSKDAPLADLFFGVDNTFLSRALAADIFTPYASPALANIPADLQLDSQQRLLPVDFGFVTLNADAKWFAERGLALPQSLDDLTTPAYKGLLVMENPATSSPGLAFLLATIDYKGVDGAMEFWKALAANDLLVTDGWSQAYFEHFTVGSGDAGNRPLVVSYTSSPPADVVYASDGRTTPASVNLNLPGGVFRQVEFVGIVKGTKQLELAQAWVDFMLDQRFQSDIPLQMFVYPANPSAELPELFTQFAPPPDNAVRMDAALIEQNREAWIKAWTEVVLR